MYNLWKEKGLVPNFQFKYFMKRLTTLLIVFIILGAGLFIWWKTEQDQ